MRFFTRWRQFKPHRPWSVPSYSSIISVALVAAGTGTASFSGATIVSATLSSAGAATETGAGGSTASTTNTASGVGTASFNGAGILTGALSSTGTGALSGSGGAYYVITLNAAGSSTSSFGTELRQIVSRRMLQDPVNCVLAGDQERLKGAKISGKLLKGIFRE